MDNLRVGAARTTAVRIESTRRALSTLHPSWMNERAGRPSSAASQLLAALATHPVGVTRWATVRVRMVHAGPDVGELRRADAVQHITLGDAAAS
jgi:hypothetical protein